MPWTTYLTNALVAGALAAGTNELAIIAILRHILPRKRTEFAQRIRHIISTDLLSPDKMRNKLDEPETGDTLRRNIRAAIDDLLERDVPPPAALLGANIDDFTALFHRFADSLLDRLTDRWNSDEFEEWVIRPFLAGRWAALRDRTPNSLLHGRGDELTAFAADWTRELERSDRFRAVLRRALDEWLRERIERSGSLSEFLPSSLVAAADEIAASQAPVVMGQIVDTLRQPDIQDVIADAVMQAIRRQLRSQGVLGGIKGAFVNVMRVEKDVRAVCRRLPDALRDNFCDSANREHFALALRNALKRGLDRELGADLSSPERRARIVDTVMGRLWRPDIFATLAARVGDALSFALDKPLVEMADRLGLAPSGDAVLNEAAARLRRLLASPATRELVSGQLDELVGEWLRRPLGRLDGFVDESIRDRLADMAAEEAGHMLRTRLADLTEESGVWDIVTASIESYDDSQLSGLVRQLARSELRWVTILGGAVGVVVGIVQTYIQSINVFFANG